MIYNLTLFVGRLLLAHIFLISGISKIFAYSGVAGYMEVKGVSSLLLPVVIGAEILGALALIFGFAAKLGAGGLALFCILAALIFHSDFSQQAEMIAFQKNLAIAGGLLVLMMSGPGGWSLQGREKGIFS